MGEADKRVPICGSATLTTVVDITAAKRPPATAPRAHQARGDSFVVVGAVVGAVRIACRCGFIALVAFAEVAMHSACVHRH
ncbi:hypothetical protein GCM10009838_13510 [Catenulispora subtropica]|uniref:Uncharacterized protein n=1 Tax=Catenulispora subtropica TaxID=450798 RepID=A0ABN2QV35_9ACTN